MNHVNKKRKICFLFVLLLLVQYAGFAQKTQQQYDPLETYNEGVILFENNHFGGALTNFSDLLSNCNDKQQQLYINARYYEAVSTLKLGNADGEAKISAFREDFPCSSWSNQINFFYGGILFKSRKYTDALEVYQTVDTTLLSEDENQELTFQSGYANLQVGNSQQAINLFRTAMEQNGVYKNDATYYYAHTQYVLGRNKLALDAFNDLRNDRVYGKQVAVYELQIHFREKNFDEVIRLGESAYDKADAKRKGEIAKMIAETWFVRGDYDKALEQYTVFQRSTKKLSRNDNYQIGFCRMKSGNYKEAIRNFQGVSNENDSLSQYAAYYLADCYVKTDQLKFAKNAFLSAYKSGLDTEISEDALFNYAKLSAQTTSGSFNEAVSILKEFLVKNPNSSRQMEAVELIISNYLSSKNYDAALKELESMNPRTIEMQKIYDELSFLAGTESYNQADYNKAVDYYLRTLNSRSNVKTRAEACFWLADSYYQLQNYLEAEKYFRQFLIMPQTSTLKIYPLAYYGIAYSDYKKENYQEAIQSFRQFVSSSYSETAVINDAWARLGDCYFMQRNYTQAVEAYEKIAESGHRESDYALFQIGLAYGAQGKYNNKIQTLNRLAQLYPKSNYFDKALYEIGSTHLVTNDQRAAIASFDRLLKERPRSVYARQALMKTGMMYYTNNQNEQALKYMKQVVENYPATNESREAINVMRNIYMDMNRLQDFFAYTEKNKIAAVTVTEKDSLAFLVAENFYQDGNCNDALKALNNYFKDHHQGAFLLKAHYYAASCNEKSNNVDAQISHWEYIINFANNDYTDEALLKAARIEYDKLNYTKAASYYERLNNITSDPLRKLEALEGSMKSNFFLANYDKAISLASQLKTSDEISMTQQVQVHYILGKSFFEKRNFSEALTELDACAKMDKSVYGAEAAYYAAFSLFNMNENERAENAVFDIADRFASHNYWVAKAFILLSDIYVANANYFQAKETLKSIIDNYQGNDLKQIAQQKLKTIESLESN
ncbi:MAG: tetratricopeptide repeat protein [Lentimicrobiaceae bacterium]|jgi:TolA-binding protein|nr:tetratricopeptide repeat protein [Lentimicrobiaceae bacterium]